MTPDERSLLIVECFEWAKSKLGWVSFMEPPSVIFDSDAIVAIGSKIAQPGNVPDAIYFPAIRQICLRTDWDGSGNDIDVLRYEMCRHITETYLGQTWNHENIDYREMLKQLGDGS